MYRTLIVIIALTGFMTVRAQHQPQFSAAGFYDVPQSGREVYDFNAGWRYHEGDAAGAEQPSFNDSSWEVVATPHTVRLVPAEASGCRNYQGKAWYRKRYTPADALLDNRLLTLYFEAVMGRTTVYINGVKATEHLGGYLPFSVELTQYGLTPGKECIIAVMTDNSNDGSFPPGKPQTQLDFSYHGGIYRDVWLVSTNKIHLTDPNQAGKIAGGGVFVQYGAVSEKDAQVFVSADVINESAKSKNVTLENTIKTADGKTVKSLRSKVSLKAGEAKSVKQELHIANPQLWHPDAPTLYHLETAVIADGKTIDGGMTRIGVRTFEFRGKEGFWLNGKPYQKLIGANRHQDFAYVGNAMPNSQHWRDAKVLRDAGCRIIRCAHYPQDPAFMDACDELGLFVIVATPGWQYWNNTPQFGELVYNDIRQMVRRDRNHASVLMWEPILNETGFPANFAVNAQKAVQEEFPGAASAGDYISEGVKENYEVIYTWGADTKKSCFVREFGDNVDDWYAHNADNRVSRSWGEQPMQVQMEHFTRWLAGFYKPDPQLVGAALWHPFDHQRGYHPDPFWGGFTDAFRQPKYYYYLFKSQIDADLQHPIADVGPMVYIAHEIGPFSPSDVTVFTNCDEVRLIVYEKDTVVQKPIKSDLPHPPVIFKGVYNFNSMKRIVYSGNGGWKKVSFVAEGLIDGKVVCRVKKMPSRRSSRLSLRLDNEGQSLQADGSDFIPVICEVTDDDGNVRRLAKERILFSVEGEGSLIGDALIGANPREVEFGSAPALIRSTMKPGKIRVSAQVVFDGEHAPKPAVIEFESVAPQRPQLYTEKPQTGYGNAPAAVSINRFVRKLTDEEKRKALLEVEKQQTEFGKKE
ncbi:MAG: glycoside hydrolase family 2 [Bacteroidales bacterium]|jgi:beta-galactosidase|nr:glycoside hydrolase family 2 [Bacteroidales bacterium]